MSASNQQRLSKSFLWKVYKERIPEGHREFTWRTPVTEFRQWYASTVVPTESKGIAEPLVDTQKQELLSQLQTGVSINTNTDKDGDNSEPTQPLSPSGVLGCEGKDCSGKDGDNSEPEGKDCSSDNFKQQLKNDFIINKEIINFPAMATRVFKHLILDDEDPDYAEIHNGVVYKVTIKLTREREEMIGEPWSKVTGEQAFRDESNRPYTMKYYEEVITRDGFFKNGEFVGEEISREVNALTHPFRNDVSKVQPGETESKFYFELDADEVGIKIDPKKMSKAMLWQTYQRHYERENSNPGYTWKTSVKTFRDWYDSVYNLGKYDGALFKTYMERVREHKRNAAKQAKPKKRRQRKPKKSRKEELIEQLISKRAKRAAPKPQPKQATPPQPQAKPTKHTKKSLWELYKEIYPNADNRVLSWTSNIIEFKEWYNEQFPSRKIDIKYPKNYLAGYGKIGIYDVLYNKVINGKIIEEEKQPEPQVPTTPVASPVDRTTVEIEVPPTTPKTIRKPEPQNSGWRCYKCQDITLTNKPNHFMQMEGEPTKRAGVCDRCIVDAIRNIKPKQEIDPTKLTLNDIRDTIEYIRLNRDDFTDEQLEIANDQINKWIEWYNNNMEPDKPFEITAPEEYKVDYKEDPEETEEELIELPDFSGVLPPTPIQLPQVPIHEEDEEGDQCPQTSLPDMCDNNVGLLSGGVLLPDNLSIAYKKIYLKPVEKITKREFWDLYKSKRKGKSQKLTWKSSIGKFRKWYVKYVLNQKAASTVNSAINQALFEIENETGIKAKPEPLNPARVAKALKATKPHQLKNLYKEQTMNKYRKALLSGKQGTTQPKKPVYKPKKKPAWQLALEQRKPKENKERQARYAKQWIALRQRMGLETKAAPSNLTLNDIMTLEKSLKQVQHKAQQLLIEKSRATKQRHTEILPRKKKGITEGKHIPALRRVQGRINREYKKYKKEQKKIAKEQKKVIKEHKKQQKLARRELTIEHKNIEASKKYRGKQGTETRGLEYKIATLEEAYPMFARGEISIVKGNRFLPVSNPNLYRTSRNINNIINQVVRNNPIPNISDKKEKRRITNKINRDKKRDYLNALRNKLQEMMMALEEYGQPIQQPQRFPERRAVMKFEQPEMKIVYEEPEPTEPYEIQEPENPISELPTEHVARSFPESYPEAPAHIQDLLRDIEIEEMDWRGKMYELPEQKEIEIEEPYVPIPTPPQSPVQRPPQVEEEEKASELTLIPTPMVEQIENPDSDDELLDYDDEELELLSPIARAMRRDHEEEQNIMEAIARYRANMEPETELYGPQHTQDINPEFPVPTFKQMRARHLKYGTYGRGQNTTFREAQEIAPLPQPPIQRQTAESPQESDDESLIDYDELPTPAYQETQADIDQRIREAIQGYRPRMDPLAELYDMGRHTREMDITDFPEASPRTLLARQRRFGTYVEGDLPRRTLKELPRRQRMRKQRAIKQRKKTNKWKKKQQRKFKLPFEPVKFVRGKTQMPMQDKPTIPHWVNPESGAIHLGIQEPVDQRVVQEALRPAVPRQAPTSPSAPSAPRLAPQTPPRRPLRTIPRMDINELESPHSEMRRQLNIPTSPVMPESPTLPSIVAAATLADIIESEEEEKSSRPCTPKSQRTPCTPRSQRSQRSPRQIINIDTLNVIGTPSPRRGPPATPRSVESEVSVTVIETSDLIDASHMDRFDFGNLLNRHLRTLFAQGTEFGLFVGNDMQDMMGIILGQIEMEYPIDANYILNVTLVGVNSDGELIDRISKPLKRTTIGRLLDLLQALKSSGTTEIEWDSGKAILDELRKAVGIKFSIIRPGQGREKQTGGFFAYLHKTDLNLGDLRIFNRNDNKTDPTNCCLIDALEPQIRHHQDKKEATNIIKALKQKIKTTFVRKIQLREIAALIQGNIELKFIQPSGKLVTTKYKCTHINKPLRIVDYKIALIDQHYFRNDITIAVTRYALRNYDAIKDQDDWWRIMNNRNCKYGITNKKLQMKPHILVKMLAGECKNLLEKISIKELQDMEKEKNAHEPIVNDKHPLDKSILSDERDEPGNTEHPRTIGHNRNVFHTNVGCKATKVFRDSEKQMISKERETRVTDDIPDSNLETSFEIHNMRRLKILIKDEKIYNRFLLQVKAFKLKEDGEVKDMDELKTSYASKLDKIDKASNRDGLAMVGYAEVPCGRLYTLNGVGIQGESRALRGLLTKDYYWDIDMKNAHVVLAYQIFTKEYGLTLPFMNEYIVNRERVIRDVIYNNEGKGITRSAVKQGFLAALNGGTRIIQNYCSTYNMGPVFQGFYKEIQHVTKAICEIDGPIFEEFKVKIDKFDKIRGRKNRRYELAYVNSLFTTAERVLLDLAVDFMKEHNIIRDNIYTKIHDGFQILKRKGFNKQYVNAAIKRLNRVIYRLSGNRYQVEFALKEIAEPITWESLLDEEDMDKYGYDPDTKLMKGEKTLQEIQWKLDYKYAERLKKKMQYNVCFFDCETDTKWKDPVTKIVQHKAYSIHYKLNNEPIRTFQGIDCVEKMMALLPDNCMLIAHNANYDYRFLIKGENVHFDSPNCIIFKNRWMAGHVLYYPDIKDSQKRKRFYIKDSYALIPHALSKLPKMYGLDCGKKEAYPYESYTVKSMSNTSMKIKKALKCKHFNFNPHLKDTFKQNIKELGLDNGDGTFDHIAYNKFYGEQDVRILQQAYDKERENVLHLTADQVIPIDIDKTISASSLGLKYTAGSYCFAKVNKLKGIDREFCQHAVYGGRVCTLENGMFRVEGDTIYRKTEEKEETFYTHDKPIHLYDFDARSLYPTAMNQMPGFLKGTPKKIPDHGLNFEWLNNNSDGYICKIKIKSVGIHRQHSVLPIRMDGKSIYDDRLYPDQIMIVTNVDLEEMIKYHKIEYDILEGLLWNEGFNPQIKKVIKNLYNDRKIYKKAGNNKQQSLKLIMNSIYGKTILKPIEKATILLNSTKEYNTFVRKNVDIIDHTIQIQGTNKYIAKVDKQLDDHESYPHVGAFILSYSKRIMNRVIYLAEDMGFPILYQDTDSMHLISDHLKQLEKEYNRIYRGVLPTLIGDEMGQFHSDFDTPKGDIEPYAVESVFLGKKAYGEKVIYNSNGDSVQHIRLKGVSHPAIQGYPLDNIEIYKKMYWGEEIEFDLTGNKTYFKMDRDLTISNKVDFTRKVSFKPYQERNDPELDTEDYELLGMFEEPDEELEQLLEGLKHKGVNLNDIPPDFFNDDIDDTNEDIGANGLPFDDLSNLPDDFFGELNPFVPEPVQEDKPIDITEALGNYYRQGLDNDPDPYADYDYTDEMYY